MRVSILFSSDGSETGGLEKQVALQANSLSQSDKVNVSVIAHGNYKSLFNDAVEFEEANWLCGWRHNPLIKQRLQRTLNKRNPDLVHAHGHKSVRVLAKINTQAKTIATAHGTKKRHPGFQSMDSILAVSEGVAKSLHPLKSSVIGNAIELSSANHPLEINKSSLCEKFNLDVERPLLVCMGRLAPVKQFDLAMKACAQLPVNLLVYGSGPESKNLTQYQTNCVKLAGSTSKPFEVYQAADALLISSEREGMSLSMLEALSVRCPVFSTAVSGAEEVLPNEAILPFAPSEMFVESLGQKVRQLITNSSPFEASFDKVLKEHAPEAVGKKLIAIYKKLVN